MKKITFLLLSLASVGAFAQTNLFVNPNFDTTVDSWSKQQFGESENTFEFVSDDGVNTGVSGAGKLTVTNVGTPGGNINPKSSIYQLLDISGLLSTTGDTDFSGIIWVKSSAPTDGAGTEDRVDIQIYSQNPEYVGAGFPGTNIVADGTWQKVPFTFTIPNPLPKNDDGIELDPTSVRVQFGVGDSTGDFFFDRATLVVGTPEEADTLSVDDFQNEEFAAYNTSNTLELNADTKISDVKIYNISGQVVSAKSSNDSSVSVSTEELSSGVYLVEATTVNGTKGLFKIAK